MDENPFYQLQKMMMGSESEGLVLLHGEVSSINPLVIMAGNLVLTGENLYVNAELVSERNGTIYGSGSCQQGTATVTGTCKIPASLKSGDVVLLATYDYQVFYVLMKAVKIK